MFMYLGIMRIYMYVGCCLVLIYVSLAHGDAGYFWHITDFHYDFTYHDRQLSCNPDNTPAYPGQFGDFWCDSPWRLVSSSVAAMAKINQDVDFVLWTGDTVLHADVSNLNYSINAEILDNCTDLLKEAFPGTPVYASLGNNDYWPDDQFPPTNNRLYNDTVVRWKDWIRDPLQDDNIRKGGYYTVKISNVLRIIVLNTNLYYKSNKLVTKVTDPGGQFLWLNQTLNDALSNQEKVLMTAHVPPGLQPTPNGFVWMHPNFNDIFLGIMRRYADIIVSMHFGHAHHDGFKIVLDNKGEPKVPIFIAPSVTPWRYKIPSETGPAHNPGIRLVKYDRQSGNCLDIHQYYLDFQKANQDGVATWQLEYKTSVDYRLNQLTGATLYELAGKMKPTNSKEFKNYWKFHSVSGPIAEQCDTTCHASVICGFTKHTLDAFRSCRTEAISTAATMSSGSYILTLAVCVLLV